MVIIWDMDSGEVISCLGDKKLDATEAQPATAPRLQTVESTTTRESTPDAVIAGIDPAALIRSMK